VEEVEPSFSHNVACAEGECDFFFFSRGRGDDADASRDAGVVGEGVDQREPRSESAGTQRRPGDDDGDEISAGKAGSGQRADSCEDRAQVFDGVDGDDRERDAQGRDDRARLKDSGLADIVARNNLGREARVDCEGGCAGIHGGGREATERRVARGDGPGVREGGRKGSVGAGQ
jgi:hypothetical protein